MSSDADLTQAPAEPGRRDPIDQPVELTLPAHARHLRLARLTATGFAGELGFSIDEIEELRLAVGEACALLVDRSPEDGRIHLTYRHDDGVLIIEGRCDCREADRVDLDPVAQAVLHTTVDGFDLYPDGDALAFRLHKRGAHLPA